MKKFDIVLIVIVCLMIGAAAGYYLAPVVTCGTATSLSEQEKNDIITEQQALCKADKKITVLTACKTDLKACLARNTKMVDKVSDRISALSVLIKDVNKSVAKEYFDLNKSLYDGNYCRRR